MNRRIELLFIWATAEILFVFGVLVWITSLRHVTVLGRPDTMFHVPNRTVFRVIGTVILAASGYLLLTRNKRGAVLLAGVVATNVLVYSVGLRSLGQANLLNYIGNMNDLPISPVFVGVVIPMALGFVVGGSGWWLLHEQLSNRKSVRNNRTPGTSGQLEVSLDIGPGKSKAEERAGVGG